MRVLLGAFNIAEYAGSELNCLSLAKEFIRRGAHVEVVTLNYAFPVRNEYEKNAIAVRNIFFDKLDYSTYDIIWMHHFYLLDYLLFHEKLKAKKIVFSSLSSFDKNEVIPPYSSYLSLCLANCEENRDMMIRDGVDQNKCITFPNYVTQDEVRYNNIKSRQLQKAAIVSNHVPDELLEAAKILKNKGICVDIYGLGYKVCLINSEVLNQYDAVISIGKTVQYGLAADIPVYCYDRFGGPGWITRDNLQLCAYHNFSGRGFSPKSPYEIADDLENNYSFAIDEYKFIREYVLENCILEKNMDHVLHLLEVSEPVNCEQLCDAFHGRNRENEVLISLYRYNLYRTMEISRLEKEITQQKKEIEEIKTKNPELYNNQKERENNSMNEEISCLEEEKKQQKKEIEEIKAKNSELEEALLIAEITEKANRQLIDDLQIKIEQQMLELNQKEANCRYLIELNNEKDKTVTEIYSSKAWKAVTILKRAKNKAIRIKKTIHNKIASRPATQLSMSQTTQTEQPLVTVGMPVYDRTDYLIESIESILHQTYSNIEIIAVCDGSPKETLDIIKRYEKEGKIRAFYYPDNSGNAVRGRNKAIREASGVYFAFQDSDDIASPNRIELSVEQMEKEHADVVYGAWKALVEPTRKIDIENGQIVYSPDCDYEMLKTTCVPCQSTVMVRTDVLKKVGGLKPQMRYREDHELWLRIAYCGYKFKSIQEVLTTLRLHGQNLELTFTDEDKVWFNLMQEEYKKVEPMKPKIAYIIPGCGISGGIAVICQHLNRLKKRGYEVLMISENNTTKIDWFPNQNVEIVTLSDTPKNIDCLVATGWSTAYTMMKIPAKRKFYFVQSDETRFSPEGSEAYQLALDSYNIDCEYLTEAKWIKRWLKDKFGKDAYYVPNGLDPDIIYCTSPRNDNTRKKMRVLLEGPIDLPYKGMSDAFAAVQDLDCEVWCISSAGAPRPEWHCDKYFSRMPMDQMKYIYSCCDILLKMSRVEGFFGPPMEMMACGGVCVVGKVTGYDEYIIDGYNALVVESGDVKGAHDALLRLINEPDLRRKLSENGKKTASEWPWETSIDTLEKIYSNNARNT